LKTLVLGLNVSILFCTEIEAHQDFLIKGDPLESVLLEDLLNIIVSLPQLKDVFLSLSPAYSVRIAVLAADPGITSQTNSCASLSAVSARMRCGKRFDSGLELGTLSGRIGMKTLLQMALRMHARRTARSLSV
jgi:hypothetical protein